MLAAATLPAAMARMAVAGPVTQSPPANTLVHIPHLPRQARHQRPPRWMGDAGLLEALDLDALSDGHDDDIRRDADLAPAIRLVGTGTPAVSDLAR